MSDTTVFLYHVSHQKEDSSVPSTYIQDGRSMLRYEYDCVFFVCRKPIHIARDDDAVAQTPSVESHQWCCIIKSKAATLEFRVDGTKINGENNTQQRHIVIKQEEKGVI